MRRYQKCMDRDREMKNVETEILVLIQVKTSTKAEIVK